MSVDTSEDAVTVRMYNVGFGDAFLLLFPGEDRPRRVLIDCGSHFLGRGPRPIKEVVGQLIADVTDSDGVARVDVVVATHRHQDHVSGFAEGAWAHVEVGEVWMPWTEDPEDPTAREIRERQSSVARRLKLGLQALGLKEGDPALALAENALSNSDAMRTLHQGFADHPPRRFLASDDGLLACSQLLGVRVQVLGPARDPEVIRDMDPPACQSYLWLAANGQNQPAAPFTEDWRVSLEDFERAWPHLQVLDQRDRDRIAAHGQPDAFSIAVQLDAAVNGTSLVLAFEIGDAVLLFPGDAQWGTWKAMLDEPSVLELLERTTFLKVGHHGSHNATPVAFVEAVAAARAKSAGQRNTWAMVSTRPMKIWKNIPKPELIAALRDTTDHLARSDETGGAQAGGFSEWSETVVEAKVPIRRTG